MAFILIAISAISCVQPSRSQTIRTNKLSITLSSSKTSQLSFTCEHLKGSLQRNCDLTFLIGAGSNDHLYFNIKRTYVDGGFEDQATIFGAEEGTKGSVSLTAGVQTLATGDINFGLGSHMQMRSRDFIKAVEQETNFTMLVQVDGRVRTYRLSYRKELSDCIKVGDANSDSEFDKTTLAHGGRAVCGYYEHLGRIEISSQAEHIQLLKNEISYLKGKAG